VDVSLPKQLLSNLDANTDHGSIYDGSQMANRLGGHVLDRSYFGVDPRTNAPEGPHPMNMNEVLELELEILLLIVRNLP
jgi:hypothetical protein